MYSAGNQKIWYILFLLTLVIGGCTYEKQELLDPADYKHYITRFNKHHSEIYPQYVPNETAWKFLKTNIPLLDIPDKNLEQTYYFRWWTYRKHIKETPDGFVITEFLPDVGWNFQPVGVF